MMNQQYVRVERDGPITVIRLDRPEVRNALHPPAQQALERVFDDFQNDPTQWVAILTGSGDQAFCAGNDLKFQAEHGVARMREMLAEVKGGFAGFCERTDLYKPVIASVNGFALGGGFEIVLACDVVVAAEHATFGLPEPRVGLVAGAGGMHRLPRQIPYHLAMGLLLTGRRISARDAERYGLVNEVVPAADLLDAARRWADEILECAPLSVRATKEAAVEGLRMPLDAAIAHRFPGLARLEKSADSIEGPRAFAEKRKPRWIGA
jgi:enoyl-CoA hydratase/carnithine racemase